MHVREYANYPISVVLGVTRESQIMIKVTYDSGRFDRENVQSLLDFFIDALLKFANKEILFKKYFNKSKISIGKPINSKQINPSPYLSKASESHEIINDKGIAVCSDMFNDNDIDDNSNFFEMGSDSLRAIKFVSKLRSFCIAINLKQLFKCQTVFEICHTVSEEATLL